MQPSRKGFGTHESSVDQKLDMIIPGQDQTELKLEKKLEQQVKTAYKPQKVNVVAEANNSTNRLNDVARSKITGKKRLWHLFPLRVIHP